MYVLGHTIMQFLMSCRVMGMDIEYSVLAGIVNAIRKGTHVGAVNGVMIKAGITVHVRHYMKPLAFIAGIMMAPVP
ncbi:hypothetical protein RAA17_10625 [Komagataeibacter rhaeticus]|nr:hypothetical protein [Komagataeibacter rhaeticus]